MNAGQDRFTPDTHLMVAPMDEGGTIFRTPSNLFDQIVALEREYAPRAGGRLLFEDDDAVRLTPFAARLFRKGYVSLDPADEDPRVRTVTAVQAEFAARLHKLLDEPVDVADDDVVIAEADLPFEGPLAAMPAGMQGNEHRRGLFGVRPTENPVEVLENILYGQTAKDDPESSHHGEHEISDGVEKV